MFLRFIILKKRFTIENIYLKGAFLFAVYSFIISSMFCFFYFDLKFLLPPLNYIFCFLCLFFVSDLIKEESFLKVTYWAIITSLVVQLILFFYTGLNYNSSRYMIMFQNPNQLGFWGLIMFLFLLSINHLSDLKSSYLLIFCFLVSSFFVIVSVSQAAIIVLVLISLIYFTIFFRLRLVISLFLFLIFSSFFYMYLNKSSSQTNEIINVLISRFDSDLFNEYDNDNNLEARNYNRIFENPKYLLFGAGESGLDRFGSDTNEIHSTLGSLLFSYGIVGFSFFIFPLFKVTLFPFRLFTLVFFIFLLFTLTHNMIRWPLFWILPYFMFCANVRSRIKRTVLI
jgi:hypothetical protein